MSNQTKVIIACSLLCWFVFLLVMSISAYEQGAKDVRQQAVNAGVAQYDVDDRGQPVFKFKDCR